MPDILHRVGIKSSSPTTVYDALATGVQGIITGQKSPDQVLQAMDAAWDQ